MEKPQPLPHPPTSQTPHPSFPSSVVVSAQDDWHHLEYASVVVVVAESEGAEQAIMRLDLPLSVCQESQLKPLSRVHSGDQAPTDRELNEIAGYVVPPLDRHASTVDRDDCGREGVPTVFRASSGLGHVAPAASQEADLAPELLRPILTSWTPASEAPPRLDATALSRRPARVPLLWEPHSAPRMVTPAAWSSCRPPRSFSAAPLVHADPFVGAGCGPHAPRAVSMALRSRSWASMNQSMYWLYSSS